MKLPNFVSSLRSTRSQDGGAYCITSFHLSPSPFSSEKSPAMVLSFGKKNARILGQAKNTRAKLEGRKYMYFMATHNLSCLFWISRKHISRKRRKKNNPSLAGIQSTNKLANQNPVSFYKEVCRFSEFVLVNVSWT